MIRYSHIILKRRMGRAANVCKEEEEPAYKVASLPHPIGCTRWLAQPQSHKSIMLLYRKRGRHKLHLFRINTEWASSPNNFQPRVLWIICSSFVQCSCCLDILAHIWWLTKLAWKLKQNIGNLQNNIFSSDSKLGISAVLQGQDMQMFHTTYITGTQMEHELIKLLI